MIRSPIRAAAILTLALLGSAGILALLTIATGFLTVQSRTASDVLPARETVFLMEQPTQEALAQFNQWFPLLEEAVLPPSAEAVALVRLPSGGTALLLFARLSGQQQAQEVLGIFPPFAVLASSPEALTLLKETKGFLSQFTPFERLIRIRGQGDQWTYIRTDALPAATGATENILRHLLFAQARFAGITSQEDRIRIDTTDQEPLQVKQLATSFPAPWPTENAVFTIAMHDLAVAFRNTMQQIPASEQAVLNGFLAQRIRTTLGQGMSMEFDVLPLLANEVALAWGRNGSGATVFAVQGETKRAEQAADLLRVIRESASKNLRGTEVRTRMFDGRFPAKDIRIVRQETQESAETENGWHVWRGRTADNSAPLVVGVKDKRFIVSNDTDAAEALLAASPGTVEPSRQSLAIQGQVQLPLFMETVRAMSPSLTGKAPPFSRPDSNARWEVYAREYVRSVHIDWKEPTR